MAYQRYIIKTTKDGNGDIRQSYYHEDNNGNITDATPRANDLGRKLLELCKEISEEKAEDIDLRLTFQSLQ